MKKFLLLLMLLCSIGASAQDVIVKKDGAAIVCRIINVSSLEVVYKKWTELQGQNYVLSVNDVASITYENGEKKVFEHATTTQPSPIVQKNYGQQTVSDDMLLKMVGKPELTPQEKLYKKAKRMKIAGWVCGGSIMAAGITSILVPIIQRGYTPTAFGVKIYDDPNMVWVGLGIGAIASSVALTLPCVLRAHNLKKQASQMSVQSAAVFQQDFKLKNGTSLSPSINMLKDNTRRNTTLGVGLTYNF